MSNSKIKEVSHARTTHKCSWCGESIEIGEGYVHWTYFEDGECTKVKMHHECHLALDDEMRRNHERDGQNYTFDFFINKRPPPGYLQSIINPLDVFDEDYNYICGLNERLVNKQNISQVEIDALKTSHQLKHYIFKKAESCKQNETTLKMLAKMFETLEFEQQKLWHFPLDKNFHHFFELPGCTCPKSDNLNVCGTLLKYISHTCPIHYDGDAPPISINHYLKIEKQPFEDVKSGIKQFEYRKDDRGFNVGDIICLEEIEKLANDEIEYTGRYIIKKISYILRGAYGVPEGFAVLSIVDPQ